MELLCHRIGSTKAFKGKGELLGLARQADECLDELTTRMRRLSLSSKQTAGGAFHYLDLHLRRARSGNARALRWRSPLHRHVRWKTVVQDLRKLPVGLHLPYREMNRRACELNALHGLCRMQRAVLDKLARAYGEEEPLAVACGDGGRRPSVAPAD
jgi:hypothetical protein